MLFRSGIRGKKLKLITKDDYNEDAITAKNIKELTSINGLSILFGFAGGTVGTKTLQELKKQGVPFVSPMFNAEDKVSECIGKSLKEKIKYTVKYLIDKQNIKQIALFYQNNKYGLKGLNFLKQELDKRGLKINSEGAYTVNTLAIRNALYEMKSASPEAIILFGEYKPSLEFIKRAKKSNLSKALFCFISKGSKFLADSLNKNEAKNVVFLQKIAFPWKQNDPLAKEYRNIFSKYYPNKSFSFVSFQNFIGAKLLVNALKKSDKKNFVHELQKEYKENSPKKDIYLTKYINKNFKVIEDEK